MVVRSLLEAARDRAPLAMACAAIPIGQLASTVVTSDAAREALLKYLERGRSVNMRAIVEQRMAPDDRKTMQLKIEQDLRGRRKSTILQPLFMQGRLSIDDGKKWLNYYPDERKLYVQDSPSLKHEDAKARMSLASSNYAFTIERSTSVAGCSAAVVVASPRFAEMPARRYTIEASRNVLLRLELELPAGDRRTLYDTKAIAFPASISPATFQLSILGDVETISLPSPSALASVEAARELLGFAPVVPANLPFGFVARDPELTGHED